MASRPASRSAANGSAEPKQAARRNSGTPASKDGRTPPAKSRTRAKPAEHPDAGLLKRLVERLPDIVFRYQLKPSPKYEYISPSVERLTGYRPDEFYADPQLDRRIVHPDDQKALMDVVARGITTPIQLRWTRKDKHTVWLEIHAVPVKNRNGDVVGFEGTARDVTSRVSAEHRARDIRAFVAALMSAASDPVAVTDAEGRLIVCNAAFAEPYGQTPAQLRGRLVGDIWQPDVARRRLRHMQRVVRTGKRVRVDDESIAGRNFDVVIEPIAGRDGSVAGLAILAREITKRKKAERKLQASEERYRLLYQDNPSMYFTVSAKGKVLSVNRFGAQQLGYEPEELTGGRVFDVFHPEDREDVKEQIKQCVANPDRVHHWELRKQRKNGETMWVKEAARATFDANGSPIILIVCEDVTERRRMEEELQKTREELENRVEQTLEKTDNPYDLTFRQLTVLHLVVQGKSDREIGLALGISPLTVNTHVSRALRKMGASSRTEAGVRALREGLIQ